MERKARNSNRSDKEIIVMSLSLTYALCVSIFAVIRLLNKEWLIGALDVTLASFGGYVFIHVWRTRKAHLAAYAIAIISVIGTVASLALKGPEQIYWAYPSVALVFYLIPNRHAVILWSITAAIILTFLIDLPMFKLITIVMTVFITSFFCFFFSSKMDQQHARLRRIANEDALTQIHNRRAFNQDTDKLAHSNAEESAILFDLDKFKQINDYFGHAKGDEVLRQVSQFVKSQIGTENMLYRIGGDEFAVLCFGRDFDYTYKMAQNIHTEFAQSAISQEHGITLSMAVAQIESDETVSDWLGRLDSALYQAKKSGRNQIVKAMRH